eukprot:c10109_g5_i1.p1 GENE.c10109_g5_i1~~c10109_g5_i1.p1  ORF type:complete len:752 (-),score=159.27 c10109_g5_i1:23-2200(-)
MEVVEATETDESRNNAEHHDAQENESNDPTQKFLAELHRELELCRSEVNEILLTFPGDPATNKRTSSPLTVEAPPTKRKRNHEETHTVPPPAIASASSSKPSSVFATDCRISTLIAQLSATLSQPKPFYDPAEDDDLVLENILVQIESLVSSSPTERMALSRNHAWFQLITQPIVQAHTGSRNSAGAALSLLAISISDKHKKPLDNKCVVSASVAEWFACDDRLSSSVLTHMASSDPTVATSAAAVVTCTLFALKRSNTKLYLSFISNPALCKAVIEALRTVEKMNNTPVEGVRLLLGIAASLRPRESVSLVEWGLCDAILPFLRRSRSDHKLLVCDSVFELASLAPELRTAFGDKGICKLLVDFLISKEDEVMFQVLRAVFALSLDNVENAERFGQLGLCSRLVKLLQSSNTTLVNTVACIICTLAVPQNIQVFAERRVCDLLVQLVASSDVNISTNVAVAMEKLVSGSTEAASRFRNRDTLSVLIDLLKRAEKPNHITALCSLLGVLVIDAASCQVVGQMGAVEAVSELLSHASADVRYHAITCLGSLAICPGSNARKAADCGACRILVRLIYDTDPDIQECAAATIEIFATDPSLAKLIADVGGCEALHFLLSCQEIGAIDAAVCAITPIAQESARSRKQFRSLGTVKLLWQFVCGESPVTNDKILAGACHALSVLVLDPDSAKLLNEVDATTVVNHLLDTCPKHEYKTVLKQFLHNLAESF